MKNFYLLGIIGGLILLSHASLMGEKILTVNDTRAVISTPASYSSSFEGHFQQAETLGLSSVLPNNYYTVLGLRGWTNNTGGKGHEIAFSNDSQILVRSGYTEGWEGWRSLLISSENGNYGIGTSSPSERLSVNGKIRAKEVKVEAVNWPDYVFDKDYEISSISTLEQYILINRHLPDVPTVREINEKGLNIGSTQVLLLKKN